MPPSCSLKPCSSNREDRPSQILLTELVCGSCFMSAFFLSLFMMLDNVLLETPKYLEAVDVLIPSADNAILICVGEIFMPLLYFRLCFMSSSLVMLFARLDNLCKYVVQVGFGLLFLSVAKIKQLQSTDCILHNKDSIVGSTYPNNDNKAWGSYVCFKN